MFDLNYFFSEANKHFNFKIHLIITLFFHFLFILRFFLESGYPNVIGIIDGSHVGLSAVPREVEAGYINHKGFHSINIQIVSLLV